MERTWWVDSSKYNPSSIGDEVRENNQYRKGIFFLFIFLKTITKAIKRRQTGKDLDLLSEKIDKHYRKIVNKVDNILNLSIFSNLQKYKPDIPYSLDKDILFGYVYLEDVSEFFKIIEIEYQLCGSETYAIPVDLRVSIDQVQSITNILPERTVEAIVDRIALKHKNYEHLTIHNDGLIEYQDKEGNPVRKYHLKVHRSDYKFLLYLAKNPNNGLPISYKIIDKAIKRKSSTDDNNEPYNRIREMYKLLQKNLELKPGELVLVDRGYKLTCPTKVTK